jgi:hypothetical protein
MNDIFNGSTVAIPRDFSSNNACPVVTVAAAQTELLPSMGADFNYIV